MKINNELDLYLYKEIAKSMKMRNIRYNYLAKYFDITPAGISQRIRSGNYNYSFLLELFPLLELDLVKVTNEYKLINKKK